MGPEFSYKGTRLGPGKGWGQPLPSCENGHGGPARPDRCPTGRSRGAIISQYYNRSVRLRRRTSRPQLRVLGRSARPSLRLYDLELDSMTLEEEGECLGLRLRWGAGQAGQGEGLGQQTQGRLPQRAACRPPAVRPLSGRCPVLLSLPLG